MIDVLWLWERNETPWHKVCTGGKLTELKVGKSCGFEESRRMEGNRETLVPGYRSAPGYPGREV